MKFNIRNEKAEYLGYFEEYDSVCWIDNSKMHKYPDERFEFSIKKVLFAMYLKLIGNKIYQHKLTFLVSK